MFSSPIQRKGDRPGEGVTAIRVANTGTPSIVATIQTGPIADFSLLVVLFPPHIGTFIPCS